MKNEHLEISEQMNKEVYSSEGDSVAELRAKLEAKEQEIQTLLEQLDRERSSVRILRTRLDEVEEGYRCIVETKSYQLFARWIQPPLSGVYNVVKAVRDGIHFAVTYDYKGELEKWWQKKQEEKEERRKELEQEKFRQDIADHKVILMVPTIDWDMPMYQRPQQLAVAFSKVPGVTVLYLTTNYEYDNVEFNRPIRDGLWVLNGRDCDLVNECTASAKEVVLFMPWASNRPYADKLNHDRLIYDFLDDLELLGGMEKEEILRHHEYLLQQADVTVCTAGKLYDKVTDRAKKAILSPNAGDYAFFAGSKRQKMHPAIQAVRGNYDCVIGYYGALASWFDYELIRTVAQKHPKWLFVLIGMDFDGTLQNSGMAEMSNIMYIPPQPYETLPSYLKGFDIATVPFVINDITLSTSPVKIFEYMAAGKPVIASAMPECMKYESVKIYSDADEFCGYVEQIMEMKRKNPYWKTLKKEALDNTWDARVRQILSALNEE